MTQVSTPLPALPGAAYTARIVAIEPVIARLPVLHRGGVPVLAGVPRKTLDMFLVRVVTDAGLIGWGEGFGLYNAWPAAVSALQTLVAPRCIGRNALDLNGVIDDMRRALHPLGRNGVVHYAWSGVEMALWDIQGKALNVPIHRLLGGARAESLKAYASLPRYGTRAAVVKDCEIALERGFEAIKVHEITVPEIRAAAECLAQRGLGGLMIDANCPWSLDEALAVTEALQDIDIGWLEEPLYPPDDYESLAALRRRSGVPLACGENFSSLNDFDTLVRLQAVEFVQPSVAKLGGISALCRMIERAADTPIEVAPHMPFFGPAMLATLHVMAARLPGMQPEAYFLDLEGNPVEAAVTVNNAVMQIPQGPGLGCDPDPAMLARVRIV